MTLANKRKEITKRKLNIDNDIFQEYIINSSEYNVHQNTTFRFSLCLHPKSKLTIYAPLGFNQATQDVPSPFVLWLF